MIAKCWQNRNTFQSLFFLYSFCWLFSLKSVPKNKQKTKTSNQKMGVGDVGAISIEHTGRLAVVHKSFRWPPLVAGRHPSRRPRPQRFHPTWTWAAQIFNTTGNNNDDVAKRTSRKSKRWHCRKESILQSDLVLVRDLWRIPLMELKISTTNRPITASTGGARRTTPTASD